VLSLMVSVKLDLKFLTKYHMPIRVPPNRTGNRSLEENQKNR
jgi:hypothetical protein